MIDFMVISTRSTKRGVIEIYPKFIIKKSSDLMIRGGDFYAIWIEERGLWSTDEHDALELIDHELDRYAEENRQRFNSEIKVLHMWDAESGMIDTWHKYCQKQMRDCFHMLDDELIFSNTKTSKTDYASKRLDYPLEAGDISAYDTLISTLYSEEERMKIEWAIGAIVSGASKKIQKFMVLYGAAGTGKSTILNIIQQLFNGYYSVFDAKALGSASNSFALEAFKSNPLVAIQHDGDLSRIEDNTRLNSLVSHELMTVNEKFKSTYANRFKCFLFMGTNKAVKITDAKSGLIRRLIDVTPSGNKLSQDEYDIIMERITFELGAIAYHCKEVYCIKLVNKMKFKSEDASPAVKNNEAKKIFYDIEVFPNLLLVNWKMEGVDNPVVRMINPSPSEIEELMQYRLIGFNCRRYDNHIIYARLMGYTNEQLYNLSQRIISGSRNCFFGEAYNVSYTDVYDFASAGNKKSLKKLEIEMGNQTESDLQKKGFTEEEIKIIKAGTHHQELGLPWDQPVPEELWTKVAEYCDNDVIATEAAFTYLKADWTARQILSDLADMSVNDTTNTLTQRIIFGNNRKPQSEFHYRNLAEPVKELDKEMRKFLEEACPKMMERPHYGWKYEDKEEVPFDSESLLPYFPGYTFDHGKSMYRGEEVGEGGFAQGFPGMYGNVALLDVSSMHPHSVIAEVLFGPRFTKAFRDIVEGRVSIKHEAWDVVNHMLDGKLTPYIQKVIDGEMTSKDLANALKTAINSVYGLTSASFDNPFRDPRNIDNIVAKRGALFMIDLKNAVLERGFKVAHIKTDSIKIPDATPEIIKFVMDFGERYRSL